MPPRNSMSFPASTAAQDDVVIVEHPDLQDGSTNPWPPEVISSHVRDFVKKSGIKTVRSRRVCMHASCGVENILRRFCVFFLDTAYGRKELHFCEAFPSYVHCCNGYLVVQLLRFREFLRHARLASSLHLFFFLPLSAFVRFVLFCFVLFCF